jgi:hypothetical protein|tara:strand:+ start:391 stop:750 length:360 start_codon:yes stop_codon:yes gene_type:complete
MILPRGSRTIIRHDAPSLVRVVSDIQAIAIEYGAQMGRPAAAMIVRGREDRPEIALRGSQEDRSAIYLLFPKDPGSNTYERLSFEGCFDPLVYMDELEIKDIEEKAYQHYSKQLEKLGL